MKSSAQRYFYLGPDLAIVRLDSGQLLYVDPQDDQMSARIIVDGHWEDWVHRCVLSLLRPGARVIEVGANLGYYTVSMAREVGPTGRITSFEANPHMVSLVRRSTTINGLADRVQIVPKAALDQSGTIDFVVSRRNSGGGFVTYWGDSAYDDGEILKVESVRLDDLAVGEVDLIRIDAEGSEPLILRGAETLLKANPDIVICLEWSVVMMGSRVSVADFVEWLVQLGFRFWRIRYDGGLAPLSPQDAITVDACDLVLARETPRAGQAAGREAVWS